MDVIHPRCAGLDISKKDAKVCVRINGAGRRKTSQTVTMRTMFMTIFAHVPRSDIAGSST